MLPNLVIIGAAKAGTTSLHFYLDQHPDVSMSQLKELHYFDRPNWEQRRTWYERQFEDKPVRGESTPVYTAWPVVPDVPERMASLIPDAKLIYAVRDPVERILSAYVQTLENREDRPFEEWMAEYDKPDNALVAQSRYAMQLERYLRFYDASQILVVDQADLMHRRDETVHRVFEFVGVDPTFTSERFDEERNTRADKRRTRGIGHHLWYDRIYPAARRVVPRAIRQRLKSPVERALYTPVTAKPVLTDEMRERLVAFLRPDVEALRQMTGQQFASWSV